MSNRVAWHELSKLSAEERKTLLTRTEDDLTHFLENVAPIIEAVRKEGDVALARFARMFDRPRSSRTRSLRRKRISTPPSRRLIRR